MHDAPRVHLLGKRLWLDVLSLYHVYNTFTRWCTRPPQNAARRTLANRLLHWNSVRLSNRCYRQEERFGCGSDVCVFYSFFPFPFEHVLAVAMGRHNQICIRCLFICNIHIESVQQVLRPHEYASSRSQRTATNVWSDVYFVFIYVYLRCRLWWRCILLRIFNFLFYGFCWLLAVIVFIF